MPIPSIAQPQSQPSRQSAQASYEQLLERYEIVTNIANTLVLAEIDGHESDDQPREWDEFINSVEDQPELVTDVLSTMVDMAAEAIIKLSEAGGDYSDKSHAEIIDLLLHGMSDQDDEGTEQEDEQ